MRLAEKFAPPKELIIQELCRHALLDPAELFDQDGKLKPISEIPPETRAAISSVKVKIKPGKDGQDETTWEYKLWDKNDALEMLSKYQKFFSDVPLTINVYEGVPTAQIQSRLAALIKEYVVPFMSEQRVIEVTNPSTCTTPKVPQEVSRSSSTKTAPTTTRALRPKTTKPARKPKTKPKAGTKKNSWKPWPPVSYPLWAQIGFKYRYLSIMSYASNCSEVQK